MAKIKVSEVVGNSFKLKQDVTAHQNSPNSGITTVWKAGRRTDPVYSWVEHNGEIWYMFGRQQPSYFIKHDADSLEPVAEHGAAKYLDEKYGGTKGAGGGMFGFEIPSFESVIKLFAAAMALVIGIQIIGLFR